MKQVMVVPLLAAGALFLGGGACDQGPSLASRITPPEIRGVWSADDTAYAGREMEILESQLVFHTGDGDLDFTVHAIHSISSEPLDEGSGTAFEIEYVVDVDAIFTFSFTFLPEEGAIFFKNEPHRRWTRAVSEG